MTTAYSNKEFMQLVMDITTPAAHFMGDYDSNLFYDYGAICMRRHEMWIFDGSTWHQLTEISDKVEEKVISNFTNCPNCGAPLHNHRCLYCGTERR